MARPTSPMPSWGRYSAKEPSAPSDPTDRIVQLDIADPGQFLLFIPLVGDRLSLIGVMWRQIDRKSSW